MLVPASTPRIKFDVANYLAHLQGKIARYATDNRLVVRLQTEATPALLQAGGFDAIVTCTGAQPGAPAVPGVDLPHVVQATDLLRQPSLAETARRVLIVGGGMVGCETAYYLAYEKGKEVTVIEMLAVFLKGMCTANRGFLLYHLHKKGCKLLNCTRLTAVAPGVATVTRNVSATVPDPCVTWTPVLPENVKNPLARPLKVDERMEELPADLVVLAVALSPDDRLYRGCLAQHVAPEIYNIGDSFAPSGVFEAVKSGYAVGTSL